MTEFIKKLRVCNMDFLLQEDLITYEFLVQEATREYHDLVDSKRWEPATSKEKSQYQSSLLKAYTVAIEQSINKALKQVDFKSHHSGNGSGSGKGSFAMSDGKCHKCGKKGHIQKDCKSKGNDSSGNTPKKSINELPEWVTRKPVDSVTQDLTIATMTRNDKKYKWCTSCNNGKDAWGFHWKDGHEEWKNKQGKKPSGHFSNPATNAVIYCSYLMTTSEK